MLGTTVKKKIVFRCYDCRCQKIWRDDSSWEN